MHKDNALHQSSQGPNSKKPPYSQVCLTQKKRVNPFCETTNTLVIHPSSARRFQTKPQRNQNPTCMINDAALLKINKKAFDETFVKANGPLFRKPSCSPSPR